MRLRAAGIAVLLLGAVLAARAAVARDGWPESGDSVRVERMPELLKMAAPEYPFATGRAASGTIIVQALVGTDGLVKRTRVVQALRPEFDEAAMAAVRRWVFAPGSSNGRPVATWVAIPIQLRMDGQGPADSLPRRVRPDLRRALAQEIVALGADSARVLSAADMDLRRWIIEDAWTLDTLPPLPREARAHLERGQRARERCGCRDSTLRAVEEFSAALREAPWWGPPYGRLGDALLRLGRSQEALVCFELYLLAEPKAGDRAQVEKRVAQLRARETPGH